MRSTPYNTACAHPRSSIPDYGAGLSATGAGIRCCVIGTGSTPTRSCIPRGSMRLRADFVSNDSNPEATTATAPTSPVPFSAAW